MVVRKVRRLPMKGEVLVKEGMDVEPNTIVARTFLPGHLQTVKVAEKLGVEPKEVPSLLKVRIGESVKVGDLIAESKGIFGLFKGQVFSEYSGTVEAVSEVSGHVLVREAPIPVEINAYIHGRVVEVIAEEGAVIEAQGALIQGIFGVGGERVGKIRMAVSSPDEMLEAKHIQTDDAGKILVGGSGITLEAIREAEKRNVVGLVSGAVRDDVITQYLGYEIGVAITGQESIPLTIVITEGFGQLAMAKRTFDLFKQLEGREASINGATQIRAGVIRPEVIVPLDEVIGTKTEQTEVSALEIGTPIRVIREPYFGELGEVVELPPELQVIDSGSEVRVLKAKLTDGRIVTVPRANVEIIAS